MKSSQERLIFEQKVVSEMIALYCRKNHEGTELCDECSELIEYARQRSKECPFREEKTFCNNCPSHCYRPAMREKIKVVMRFSGPRMIFYHPVLLVKHVVESSKEKRKQA